MARASHVAEAFRRLQQGDAAACARVAREALRAQPDDSRAHLALGMALRAQGSLAEARESLERAARLAPGDHAPAFELGVLFELAGDSRAALASYEKAIAARPDFIAARLAAAHLLAQAGRTPDALVCIEAILARQPASAPALHEKGWILHRSGNAVDAIVALRRAIAIEPGQVEWRLDLAKALVDAGDDAAAREQYESLIAQSPRDVRACVEYGRFRVARGDFAHAESLFRAALELAPTDAAIPIYLAQAALVQGRWREGWRAYARREPRRLFEAARARRGLDYALPSVDSVAGRELTLIAEQGLGDALFYLRFAPRLAAIGAKLHFRGDARLVPLLRRSGWFASCAAGDVSSETAASLPILVADLPALEGMDAVPAPLAIAPDSRRVERWRGRLAAAGQPPWIGIAWRAGTPSSQLAHGLYKTVPLEALCRAIAPLGGTVFSLQRMAREGEIEMAGAALASRVHDLAAANDDLEDALALVSLLDRHACVSNTNVHLAAAAGAKVDVLVAFPPEWRWGASGASPWFPSFEVHRQLPGGDWSAALANLARTA